MIRKFPKAPELHLYGSGRQLHGPEVLQRTGTASLWFRRETLWSGSPPKHCNFISMVPERISMVRKSSKAPELHLYGSSRQLHGTEVLHSTGTESLWFRPSTLWSESPPKHRNCISMVPERNSMVQKSSKAPKLHFYGSGRQLHGPKVLHSTGTPSLWFRPSLYGPKVLQRTGTPYLCFRRETLWSGSPPEHWNCISTVPAVNSMVRKSSKAPELHLYSSGEKLYGLEFLQGPGSASLWFRPSTLWSGSPPKHRNCISMVPTVNSTVRKSSTAT